MDRILKHIAKRNHVHSVRIVILTSIDFMFSQTLLLSRKYSIAMGLIFRCRWGCQKGRNIVFFLKGFKLHFKFTIEIILKGIDFVRRVTRLWKFIADGFFKPIFLVWFEHLLFWMNRE